MAKLCRLGFNRECDAAGSNSAEGCGGRARVASLSIDGRIGCEVVEGSGRPSKALRWGRW